MGRCVNYVENTLDYAEISTVNKIIIDNKTFWMYWTTVKWKALQSLTHNVNSSIMHNTFANFYIRLSDSIWYKLMSGISSFTQFFYGCVENEDPKTKT